MSYNHRKFDNKFELDIDYRKATGKFLQIHSEKDTLINLQRIYVAGKSVAKL